MRKCITLFAVCCTLLYCIGASFAASAPAHINVKDCGATGDGKTDDTKAILSAIEKSTKQNLPVYLPKGSYKLTKPLSIDKQSIVGAEPGAWNADSGPMPQFLIAHNKGPALTMKDGASVHGINFNYEPRIFDKYPPAISMMGQGLSITNIRLQYPDDGIVTAEGSGPGRVNIENVFIISPRGVGLHVTQTLDIPTIRNVEVWNNLHHPGVTAFKFGRNDGLRASHLFAFHTEVGFELDNDPAGGTWGVFTDCGTDAVGVAWKAVGKVGHTIGLTGGYLWNHHQAFLLNNPNVSLRVTGMELQSNGSPVVTSEACHTLILTGCRIGRAYENPGVPYFDLKGVDMFSMGNCTVASMSPIFQIGNGIKQASIQGNVFESSPFERIVKDERSAESEIIIDGNVGMKPTPRKEAQPAK